MSELKYAEIVLRIVRQDRLVSNGKTLWYNPWTKHQYNILQAYLFGDWLRIAKIVHRNNKVLKKKRRGCHSTTPEHSIVNYLKTRKLNQKKRGIRTSR